MKYVLAWEFRANSEETTARGLQIFGSWAPSEGINFLQFVGRVDGRGGFAVIETEDPTLIAHGVAIFSPFAEYSVYPVLDIQESVRITGEAAEFRRSAG
jgi:hypothetical protein